MSNMAATVIDTIAESNTDANVTEVSGRSKSKVRKKGNHAWKRFKISSIKAKGNNAFHKQIVEKLQFLQSLFYVMATIDLFT